MVLYILIIFLAAFFIILFNAIFGASTFDNYIGWLILYTLISVVYEILIDGLFAFIIHSMPNKMFSKDKKFFQVSKKERQFYDKIHIKSWKDNVIELGALGGFRKNKLRDKDSPEYIEKFLIESNKGIIVHIVGMFVGFSVIFILPLNYAFRIGIWVAFVNIFLNLLPTFILRYNIPRLLVGLKRANRLQKTIDISENN